MDGTCEYIVLANGTQVANPLPTLASVLSPSPPISAQFAALLPNSNISSIDLNPRSTKDESKIILPLVVTHSYDLLRHVGDRGQTAKAPSRRRTICLNE